MKIFKHKQLGLTFVELMVAMTLGLILMLTVSQIFVNSKQTYRTQDDMSRMQESARYAQALLARTIRVAGFHSNPGVRSIDVFTASLPIITGTNDAGLNTSDTITLRFQGSGNGSGTPDGTVIDCLGNAIDSNVMVMNTFYIAAGTGGEPALYCDNTDDGTVNGTELVTGVETMQVLYGEDTSGDQSADRFVAAGTAGLSMDRVVSVQIGFVFRTPNLVDTLTNSKTYALPGMAAFNPGSDRRMRRTFTTTVNLRNRTT
jgi:type IV pilus assembly protein PilW